MIIPPGVFAVVQLVVLLTDGDVALNMHDTVRARLHSGGVKHVAIYADTERPDLQILGVESSSSEGRHLTRQERMFPSVLEHAPPGVHWFVMTEGDTFWHYPNLAREISRIDEQVAPASARNDFLLVGGGGYVIFSTFTILSLPAVAAFANRTWLDDCRQRLLECRPYPPGVAMPNEFAQMKAVGCHYTGPGSGRAAIHELEGRVGVGVGVGGGATGSSSSSIPYLPKDLLNYCAAERLAAGSCGSKGLGCEWRFGQLARDPEDVTPPKVAFARWKAGKGPPSANEKGTRLRTLTVRKSKCCCFTQ